MVFSRRFSPPITVVPLDAGPGTRGISPVSVPAVAVGAVGTVAPSPLAVTPIGFMMSDGAAYTCPKETMSNEVPGDAADHRSFDASGRLRWAG
jgi:hypothetical protein